MKKQPLYILSFLLLLCGAFPLGYAQSGKLGCPKPPRAGQPVRMHFTVYAAPHLQYFAFEQAELGLGIRGGATMGVILSRHWQFQTGVEYSRVDRTIDRTPFYPAPHNYRTTFVEIPVEFRWAAMRFDKGKGRKYLVLGLGPTFVSGIETNHNEVEAETWLFHQLFLRVGVEESYRMNRNMNFVWGVNGRADLGAVTDNFYSYINGTYSLGAKVGIQFGF